MKQLKLSQAWRPTQSSLTWAFIVWGGLNFLTVAVTKLPGFSEPDAAGLYPAASVLGRLLLSINIVMLVVFVFLFSGMRMNNDYLAPQPHPFATQEFWVSVSSVLIAAFLVILLLSAFQVQLYRGFTNCNLTALVLVILAMLGRKGTPSMLGIGFGVGAVLIVGFCTILP